MTRRTVLMVSTATLWLGTARMPRALANAGFDVALLAPRDSLALKSRFVSRAGLLSENAVPMEFLLALMRMVDKVAPELLVPCDEMAVRLLFTLVLNPPPGMEEAIDSRLAALIRKSLGDPRFYAASIDKTLLPSAAFALGVRMPRGAVFSRAEDAVQFAEANGYPVVVKRRYSFAGKGVEVVATRDELLAAARRLLQSDPLDLGDQEVPRLLVQAFVAGPHHSQALVALEGQPCASFAWERQAATRTGQGQTTVLRFVHSPETRAFSDVLCRAFGICGFFNTQFAIAADTGEAHLLEINRRVVTHMHLGERAGADLAVALYRALAGEAAAPDSGASTANGSPLVVFPREWLRDAESRHLRDFPADIPWDDPGLFAAMIAWRDRL